MAKSLAESLLGARDIGIDVPSTVSDSLAAQWRNPNGVLSILLLLGPDIVQKAIAQLTGRVVTPVAFSFGWVAYAASSILSVVSGMLCSPLSSDFLLILSITGGRLMPACDTPEPEVIGAESGHKRTTKNWVLSRLLRDLEYGIDKEMLNEQDHGTTKSAVQDQAPPRPAWEALRISVFKVDESRQHGVPSLDWVWFSGFAIIIIQLLISIIPWIIDANWAVFMLTLLGNVLALIGSSLPQWRKEKWACTRQGGSTVTLTRGNGSRYAILILGKKGVGLDLEILAQGTRTVRPSWVTGIIVGIIAVLWIMLLLCANEVDQNTWCKPSLFPFLLERWTDRVFHQIYSASACSVVSKTSLQRVRCASQVRTGYILAISQ
jgi:hypothetical protein